jgi:hypothetical protein
LVAVTEPQLGNIGREPYWSWYGFESRVEWCACFVSWCANEFCEIYPAGDDQYANQLDPFCLAENMKSPTHRMRRSLPGLQIINRDHFIFSPKMTISPNKTESTINQSFCDSQDG